MLCAGEKPLEVAMTNYFGVGIDAAIALEFHEVKPKPKKKKKRRGKEGEKKVCKSGYM